MSAPRICDFGFSTSLHDDCDDITFPKSLLDPQAPFYCFGIAWRDHETQKTGFFNFAAEASMVDFQGDKNKFKFQFRDMESIFAMIRKCIASSAP